MSIKFPKPIDEFAQRCGVNKWVLYKIQAGDRLPTVPQAKAIASAWRPAFQWWLCFEGVPIPDYRDEQSEAA